MRGRKKMHRVEDVITLHKMALCFANMEQFGYQDVN
jgi:hypothetical protein